MDDLDCERSEEMISCRLLSMRPRFFSKVARIYH
jgi:hypothetical protein